MGSVPYYADKIAERLKLPQKVFPLVGLTVGYPAENPPTRPRYPLEFVLFENEYPELDKNAVNRAKKEMNDETYLPIFFYHTNNIDEKKHSFKICSNKLFK